jgi:uncharacterized protein (TIGR02217 family)
MVTYARVSQLIIQAPSYIGTNAVRVSQEMVEACITITPPPVRASQLVIESVIHVTPSPVRVSQFFVCAVIPYKEIDVATYPTLVGLGFSVMKSPLWSTGTGKPASGRDIRVGYWGVNKWKWELTYEYLPDAQLNGTTASDYKTLQSFYINVAGGLLAFCFLDPDDNSVVAGPLGTGDGTTTQFTVGRYYNGDDTNPFEPVGVLNTSNTLNVYNNGTLVSPSVYTVLTAQACNQIIRFNTAPAEGAVLTITFSFYFWVTFADDNLEFEKFVNQIWSLKTVTLISQRQ